MKTPERYQWRCIDVFIVNFEHISHLVLVFLLLNVNKYLPTGLKRCSVKSLSSILSILAALCGQINTSSKSKIKTLQKCPQTVYFLLNLNSFLITGPLRILNVSLNFETSQLTVKICWL